MHLRGLIRVLVLVSFFLPLGSISFAASPPRTRGESALSLEPIKELTDWFPKLVASFDSFVEVEKKKQFLRQVQRLARQIQGLENRKIEFDAMLKTSAGMPKNELMDEVASYSSELQTWLIQTSKATVALADTLSGTTGEAGRTAAQKLNAMLEARFSQQFVLVEELRLGVTNPERLRQNNLAGMDALREARRSLGLLLEDIEKKKPNQMPEPTRGTGP